MDTKDRVVILDGAMGTMLQQAGMKVGEIPELLNIKEPEMVNGVYRKYVDAGSDIIYACTFGANRRKLGAEKTREVVAASTRNAKACAEKTGAKVALDIGPIGEMLEPLGTLKFEEAISIFKEVVEAAKDNVDIIVIETMTDLLEVKAAILAARETTNKPIFVTMTFEKDGRTFAGVSIETFANMVQGLGVSAIGINCSLGPKEMIWMVKKLSEITDVDLIVKPNAGLPDMNGKYNLTPDEFTKTMGEILELGVKYIGGCCGTDERFIRNLSENFKGQPVKERTVKKISGPSSGLRVLKNSGFKVVGERLNPTGKKRFQEALREENMDFFVREAISQVDAGADILDVNVGFPGIDEAKMQAKIVKSLQSVIDTPLQIDSTKPEVIESALRVYNGKAIVNSVNGEEEKLESILPIVKKYNAQVIALLIDERGIPETAEERIEVAKKIVSRADEIGISRDDIYIDCLTLTVSSNPEGAMETLKTMELVRDELGVKTVLGVSNISFGLPMREAINEVFLMLAMNAGLNLAIINPNTDRMMEAVHAYKVLKNEKGAVDDFIERFSNKETAPVLKTESMDIKTAVYKGLKENVKDEVKRLLKEKTELEIVDYYLIPALDKVGDDFEKGVIFLPQLIKSASAAEAGFEVIKAAISKSGKKTISKGDIIVATVKGDIHDIGKNIAKVILENYGYNVIDLGRNVDAETIVEEAKKRNVKLIGLSALMTTTLENMKLTILRIKEELPDAKIMVGGAVLTEDYADEICANFYLKDAKNNVLVAKKVFGE